jgi:hypothetical protein
MTTTLAEVNATLGITNIALSSVAKEQKQTNEGISKFVDFMKSKDTRDRREDIEDKRETKASVLSRVGSAAGAAGGAAVGLGKKGLNLGKGLFGGIGKILPIGLAGAFLTSLLGSKLLRGGITGLGFMFGDQIAEFLTGPNAKKEVKDMVSGAVKGGALGFLLGPRFGLIGAILGGLLQNDEIDKQAGRLLTNLENFEVKFPALGKFFTGLTGAIGSGLTSINNLLEGNSENKVADIAKSIALIGGIAALFMPGKLFALLAGATKLMMRTPAGLALLAIGGGGLLANKLMGNEVTEGEVDSTAFGTGAALTATGLYAGKKGIDKLRGKSTGGKAADIDPSSKGLRGKGGAEGRIDKSLMKSLRKYPRLAKFLKFAGRFGGLGSLIGIAELTNMARTGNLTADAIGGLFGGVLGGVGGTKLGALMGSFFPGPGTVIGGLLGGGFGYLAGDSMAKALGQWMLGKKVDAFGFGFGWANDLFNGADSAAASRSTATSDLPTSTVSKSQSMSGIRNQFQANRNAGGVTANTIDPKGNTDAGSVSVVNSNNNITNNNNSTGFAINSSGAIDPRNAFGKIAANASGLF